jgi:predicted metal-binding protein
MADIISDFTNDVTKEIKMKKIAVVGCGAYMDSGYGCPGEWRCLKAAALGDGNIEEPSLVIAFVKCECPGRTIAPNMGMTMKLSEIKPDEIYLSSCLVNAKPGCPYTTPEEIANVLENKTGIKVVMGTHDYH